MNNKIVLEYHTENCSGNVHPIYVKVETGRCTECHRQVSSPEFVRGWRPMRKEDCRLGVLVRINRITDGYNIATIIKVENVLNVGFNLVLGRPYVYASEPATRQPLMGCEVFDASYRDNSDLDVYQDSKGEVRTMKT